MIPEMPPRSLELEPPCFDQIEHELDITLANLGASNKDKNFNYNYNYNINQNSISFDESVAVKDETWSDEEATTKNNKSIDVIPIGDIVSDYEDSDIELMQEALSVFTDEEQRTTNANGNRCGYHRDKHIAMKNCLKKNIPGLTPYPVRFIQQTHDSNGEQTMHTATDNNKNNNNDVDNGATIGLYPSLLPQVTFDEEEEEELDRRNFFDQDLQQQRCSQDGTNVPTPSPHLHQEPSSWLLQQLVSDAPSFPQSSSGASRSKTVSRINSNRANKDTKHKHWSDEEDETLNLAVETEQIKPIDWMKIARTFFSNTRSATQCKNRWKNVSKKFVRDVFLVNLHLQIK